MLNTTSPSYEILVEDYSKANIESEKLSCRQTAVKYFLKKMPVSKKNIKLYLN